MQLTITRNDAIRQTAEKFVVNSNAGDGINGKVYGSWADANTAIAALYGADWDDAAEPEAEIVAL